MLDRPNTDHPVSIRRVDEDDDRRLARVAALDSQRLAPGPWLVAVVDGSAVAVLSLSTGAFVADPFSRTVELRALLELRGEQLRAAADHRRRRGRLVPRRRAWISAALAAPSSIRPS
jgi:hypothetical protein